MDGTIEGAGRSSGKRRYWTIEEKRQMVEETLGSSSSVATLARQHGVNANQLFYWRKLYHAGQLEASPSFEHVTGVHLLPVSVEAEPLREEHDRVAAEQATGTINIEIPGRALVSVEGRVDASVVRAVLESLRG
jgi:transposase